MKGKLSFIIPKQCPESTMRVLKTVLLLFMYVERNVASDELPHVKLILPSENLYCP